MKGLEIMDRPIEYFENSKIVAIPTAHNVDCSTDNQSCGGIANPSWIKKKDGHDDSQQVRDYFEAWPDIHWDWRARRARPSRLSAIKTGLALALSCKALLRG